MQIKAVLSDLDKTLIEDSQVPTQVTQVIQGYLHVSPSLAEKIVKDFFGIQTSKAHFLNGYTKVGAWKHILRKYTIPYGPQTIFEMNHLFWTTAAKYARPYPGTLEALALLKSWGIHIGIVSGGDYVTRFQHLRATGILPYIDTLVTTEERGTVKHKENLYRYAAEEIGVRPEETIVVGDSEIADIYLPQQDGFITVKVAHTNEPSVAHVTIATFADIVKVVQQYLTQP